MKKNMTTTTLLTIPYLAFAAIVLSFFAYPSSLTAPPGFATQPTVRLRKIPALQFLQKLQKLGKPKQSKTDKPNPANATAAQTAQAATESANAEADQSSAEMEENETYQVDESAKSEDWVIGLSGQNITNANLAAKLDAAITKFTDPVDHARENVTRLDVYFTNLTALHPGIFNDLYGLKTLNLSYNYGLTTIKQGAFKGLTGLKKLYLGSNNLINLNPSIFKGLKGLQKLYLGGNKPPFTPEQQTAIKAYVKAVAPQARVIFE